MRSDELATFEDMSVSQICVAMGVRFRAERIRMGMSQIEMAMRANLPLRTYRRLESSGAGTLRVLICALRACNRLRALQIALPQPELPKIRNALTIAQQPRVRRPRAKEKS